MNCAVSWRLRQPAKEQEDRKGRRCPRGRLEKLEVVDIAKGEVNRSSSSVVARRRNAQQEKKLIETRGFVGTSYRQRNGTSTDVCVMLAGDGWNE